MAGKDPAGCAARLVWLLDMREPRLRRFGTVARPVLGWAHDRLISIGVRQFERVALSGVEPSG